MKLAIWYEEANRNLERLEAAAEDLRIGKISGAVGTFAHIGPEVEETFASGLIWSRSRGLAGHPTRPACAFCRHFGNTDRES